MESCNILAAATYLELTDITYIVEYGFKSEAK